MTDISALFASDDAVFDLPIMGRDPETKEDVDTGVVFQVRSLKNPDSVAVVKKYRNALIGKRMTNNSVINPEELGEITFMEAGTDPSDEQLAHCVTGWDWGDKTFGKLPTKHSHENVVKVLKAAPWIKSQVLRKVVDITDFIKA
jgi:hypothetical protein